MTCCVAINANEVDYCIQSVIGMNVIDVTQMSYQSSDRVYRAQKVSIVVYIVYRACKVNKGKFSVYRAHSVIKGIVAERQCLPRSLGKQRI